MKLIVMSIFIFSFKTTALELKNTVDLNLEFNSYTQRLNYKYYKDRVVYKNKLKKNKNNFDKSKAIMLSKK